MLAIHLPLNFLRCQIGTSKGNIILIISDMVNTRLEKEGLSAVRRLRESKLANGLPFMINSNTLPSHQCYLEYPDGSIKIVEANASKADFIVVGEADAEWANKLRKKFELL